MKYAVRWIHTEYVEADDSDKAVEITKERLTYYSMSELGDPDDVREVEDQEWMDEVGSEGPEGGDEG